MEPKKKRFIENAKNFGFNKKDAIIFKIGELKKIDNLIN